MIPYVVRYLSPEIAAAAMDDIALARAFFARLPEPELALEMKWRPLNMLSDDYGQEPAWSCHALARAAKTVLPLSLSWIVQDGDFTKGCDHSWLVFEHDRLKLVLDIYPVASLSGPMLVDAHLLSPWRKHYIPWTAGEPDLAAKQATFQAEGAIAARTYMGFAKLIGEGP